MPASIAAPWNGRDTGLLALAGLISLGGLMLVVIVWRRERRREVLVTSGVAPAAPQPSLRSLAPPPVADDEANLPRWLRPSVRAQRFAQPIMRRMAVISARDPLVFREPPVAAIARMVLRYDGVALLDQPTETLATTLAELGTEDEVDIMEVRDAWALVRTPDGLSGWLPTMTLRGKPNPVEPASQEPEPADDWYASGHQA